MGCGQQVMLTEELNEVTISSPNYPSASPMHAECEWVVTGPVDHAIRFDVIDNFDVFRMSSRYPSLFLCVCVCVCVSSTSLLLLLLLLLVVVNTVSFVVLAGYRGYCC